jgi:hypothetical protein
MQHGGNAELDDTAVVFQQLLRETKGETSFERLSGVHSYDMLSHADLWREKNVHARVMAILKQQGHVL